MSVDSSTTLLWFKRRISALNDNVQIKEFLLNEGLLDKENAGLMLGSVHTSTFCSNSNQETRN